MNDKCLFLEKVWQEELADVLNEPRMRQLFEFVCTQRTLGKNIYPEQGLLFNALNSTSIENVKVVILGQDPYHGAGQANGLSFSVERGVKIPPSLRNIYKELVADTNFVEPGHGDLTEWAKQGVLLLNSVLTVEEGMPASHKNKGWEWFTDRVIDFINQRCENVVFIFWGAYAQKKGKSIDQQRHLVLSSVHPSPLSAHRGFFGCKHFSKANQYLKKCGTPEVDWQIK